MFSLEDVVKAFAQAEIVAKLFTDHDEEMLWLQSQP